LVQQGRRVLFTPTFALIARLLRAKRDLELERELRRLDRFAVVVLDEIGYVVALGVVAARDPPTGRGELADRPDDPVRHEEARRARREHRRRRGDQGRLPERHPEGRVQRLAERHRAAPRHVEGGVADLHAETELAARRSDTGPQAGTVETFRTRDPPADRCGTPGAGILEAEIFPRNHRPSISASDLLTVQTSMFRTSSVLVFVGHARRELVHLNVTAHPTAAWIRRQLIAATPVGTGTPRPDPGSGRG
jgi:IstB-like ATP binding protein